MASFRAVVIVWESLDYLVLIHLRLIHASHRLTFELSQAPWSPHRPLGWGTKCGLCVRDRERESVCLCVSRASVPVCVRSRADVPYKLSKKKVCVCVMYISTREIKCFIVCLSERERVCEHMCAGLSCGWNIPKRFQASGLTGSFFTNPNSAVLPRG